MGLFDKLFSKDNVTKYKDTDIVSIANAEMVPASKVNDVMFAQEMMGQTIAFELKDGVIVAPANGKLEVMYPTGHAFAIRTKDGTGLLVHVGINTVELGGKGFEILVKQGDTVKAGQQLLHVDLDVIKEAGYDTITMLIVTETPNEGEKVAFVDFGDVSQGQKINK
ncbi:PTS sugar transporter subunit IIA [Anaerorhabdus sp.]|uniref:PTS sugar transporter subunit IIA n=1 Tax=Anaerorhabdus sp. TaxID=1872524 RepID=UPI002B20E95B|nr:PTS glucose transporter subunit IIA [Anaerorhabdus sp.]MEA4874584.1 PTS glucose transporter subunit IIA [Anaerorhabdus sp.]